MSNTGFYGLELFGLEEVLGNLDAFPAEVKREAWRLYSEAMYRVYDDSQQAVPVDKGDLKASGEINEDYEGFTIGVSYGDGEGSPKSYSGENDLGEAIVEDGYAWFVHEGHHTVSGSFVPANPYLGPFFDQEEVELMNSLAGLFS